MVDEYGGTAGLVTMEDRRWRRLWATSTTSSIPRRNQGIIALGDNRWRIAGSAELDDVAEALDMEFPEDEESETLGGLVFAQLNVIPEGRKPPRGGAVRPAHPGGGADRPPGRVATVTKLAPSESEEDAE